MNLTNASLPTIEGATQGAEAFSTSLARKKQLLDGQSVLALLDSAAQVSNSVSQSSTASSAGKLGSHINIKI